MTTVSGVSEKSSTAGAPEDGFDDEGCVPAFPNMKVAKLNRLIDHRHKRQKLMEACYKE